MTYGTRFSPIIHRDKNNMADYVVWHLTRNPEASYAISRINAGTEVREMVQNAIKDQLSMGLSVSVQEKKIGRASCRERV